MRRGAAGDDATTCVICLVAAERVACRPCGHAYCEACIQRHLLQQLTCPLCRGVVLGLCSRSRTCQWRRRLPWPGERVVVTTMSVSEEVRFGVTSMRGGLVVGFGAPGLGLRPGYLLHSVNGIRCIDEGLLRERLRLCRDAEMSIRVRQVRLWPPPWTHRWRRRWRRLYSSLRRPASSASV